jgi:hypothetical protein
MFKSNFKILFLVMFSFANNLQAMQENAKQNVEESISKTEDAFIREFADSMKNPKVEYDGKTLTLYAHPSNGTLFLTFMGIAASTAGLCACLTSKEKDMKIAGSFCMIALDLMCIGVLSKLLDYDDNKIPYLTIDDTQLKYWDEWHIKWDEVDRLEMLNTLESCGSVTNSYSTIQLCDKFLNSLLNISDRNGNSPISINNLFAILEHYMVKSSLKCNKL